MKDDGVTRENARSRHVDKRYSDMVFHLDSLGRIQMELYVWNLQITTIQTLESLGVGIHLYAHQKGMPEAAAVNYLKKSGVGIIRNYLEGPGIIDCSVPFDAVEEIAKMKSISHFNAALISINHTGLDTSKGDTVLNAYKARDLFLINGNNLKVGIISNGIYNWQNYAPPNGTDLPVLDVVNAGATNREGIAMSEIVYGW
jgi:hypothetical protein